MYTVTQFRKSLIGIVIGAALCVTSASAQIPVDDPRLKTDQFDFQYVEPTNPAHTPLYEALKRIQLLEKLKEFLSPLRLPIRILMKTEGCNGVANAYFEKDTIKVCYEYFEYIMKQSPKAVRRGLTPRDALIGPVVDVFLHELGHGIVRVLDIPFFAKEEDTADYIATYILLKLAKDDARRLIVGTAFLMDAEAKEEQEKAAELSTLADSHSLPAQRLFNRLCMAYGSDKELFADAIELGKIPPNRVKWCRWEWVTNEDAFKRLIRPYVDEALWQKVSSKQWFAFESPAAATMSAPKEGAATNR